VEARRSLKRLLQARKPDVAHLHNVYHQLTLSIVDELRAQNIPIVLTLHDYKPVCPSYVVYTKGEVCHRCVGSHPGHAIVHRCIKGSRAASAIAVIEAGIVASRRSYGNIDAFISPSQHLAGVMASGGLNAARIHVIPNFVADEQFRAEESVVQSGSPMVVFVGRLEDVKGIHTLLEAARLLRSNAEVVIVGGGPLEAAVEAAAEDGAVRYEGRKDWPDVAAFMDNARAVLVPSLWEENCPMVTLEAGARHCSVIGSDRGGLRDLVRHDVDGILFPTGDAAALAQAIDRVCEDGVFASRLGRARYTRTLEHNTANAHLPTLMMVYEEATKIARSRSGHWYRKN
jgi:glycosyltransferase involved in cell wall biosynthesis